MYVKMTYLVLKQTELEPDEGKQYRDYAMS
jgi:hypothetical protein